MEEFTASLICCQSNGLLNYGYPPEAKRKEAELFNEMMRETPNLEKYDHSDAEEPQGESSGRYTHSVYYNQILDSLRWTWAMAQWVSLL